MDYIPVRKDDLQLLLDGLDEYWQTLPGHQPVLKRIKLAIDRNRTTKHYVNVLKNIASIAQELVDAFGQKYVPSGDFSPETEHLEIYMDVCWNALDPIIRLKAALKELEEMI
jgi:hypothetical protein